MRRALGWSVVVAIVTCACGAVRADQYDWTVCQDGQGPVLVVRNSRPMTTPEQTRQVAAEVEVAASLLDAAGLPLRVVDDADVGPEALSEASLVVLPSNPRPAPKLDGLLQTYVLKGGRVLSLGGGPETHRALGLTELALRKARHDGEFAAITFADDAPQGLVGVANPAAEIHVMDAAAPGVRVLAHWSSADGKRSAYPAVIATSRCVYVAAALTEHDADRKADMLLRLASHLCPPLGRRAAERLIARIPTKEAAGDNWQEAARCAAEARARLAADEPLAAAALARQALAAADRAAAADMAPRDGEWRIAWPPGEGLPAADPAAWNRLAARLAEARFTVLAIDTGNAAQVIYPSRLMTAGAAIAAMPRAGNPLDEAIKAAHDHGLKLFAVRHLWHAAGDEGFAARKLAALGLCQENRTQASIDWGCPNHPDMLAKELAVIKELMTDYPVDGFVAMAVGFGGPEACTCRRCREQTERHFGKAIDNWPAAVFEDELIRRHWLAMRRQTTAEVIRQVAATVRGVRPRATVAVALDLADLADADRAGLDWAAWARGGSVDLVVAIDRDVPDADLAAVVADQVAKADGKTALVPILASTAATGFDWAALAQRIDAVRSARADGYGLWPMADPSGRLLHLLRIGPNRPASPPATGDHPAK